MKNKGFSLVELIVVIAIMAILVGVAVPVYTSYIDKASKSKDIQLVDEIVHAVQIGNAADPFVGTAAIVLSDGDAVITGADADKQWLIDVLTATFGNDYAQKFQLSYGEWGNGVAVAKVMLDALNNGNVSSAMQNIYGNADNLSFTEEIPALLEEIKNVAVEVAGDGAEDSAVIGIVNGAAAITSTWNTATIQELWNSKIRYDGNKYVHSATIPSGTTAFDEKLTIAGLIRAKNTCLALYAAENGFPELYTALSAYSADGSILPVDLTYEATASGGAQRIAAKCGITDPSVLNQLAALLNTYYNAEDANGNKIYKNDAAAYFAMMNIVDTMAEDETLSGDNLDEYFDSVSGPAALFQQLVAGTINIDSLTASLNGVSAGENNVTISFIGDGKELTVVVGPSSVLE